MRFCLNGTTPPSHSQVNFDKLLNPHPLADNTTVRLDMDNEPQPDVLLKLEERVGGQSRIDDDDYVAGAPELIAEIAASSAVIDLRDKLRVYRRVQEYLVWQVRDRRLDWFTLTEYVPLQADAEGVLRSEIFPGLWLAVPALLEEDFAGVLAVLQEGLGTSDRGAFVQQLRQVQSDRFSATTIDSK